MTRIRKSILIPHKNGKILLQDRTGHKPPPWGFFGGSIEPGETPMQALIRETFEELTVNISENDVSLLAKYDHEESDRTMYVYLWGVVDEDSEFVVNEGKAMQYVGWEEAQILLQNDLDLKIFCEALAKIEKA